MQCIYTLHFKVFLCTQVAKLEYIHNGALGKSGSVLTSLLDDYLQKGYILYCDNFYTNPVLFSHLFTHGTGAYGTVRVNRKVMPTFKKKLKKGEIDCHCSDELLVLTWHDKWDVRMLTTVHNTSVVPTNKVNHKTGEVKHKPQCIVDYTKYMGAVDKSDMQVSLAECTCKAKKWYKKFFFPFS